jgi:hypothetical protein
VGHHRAPVDDRVVAHRHPQDHDAPGAQERTVPDPDWSRCGEGLADAGEAGVLVGVIRVADEDLIAEDNLLLLTDSTGSSDPVDRVLTEVKALHRDVHDLQDAVDDILESLGLDGDPGGAKMRKPTIIEELPETTSKPAETPEPAPSGLPPSERPRSRPGV